MAKRLTQLQLSRIDVVDKGANPGAHITLVKRAVTKEATSKTVGGETLHAGDFAYVGDAQDPETWKLPIHDAGHARNALARFSQTEGIPAGEQAAVKRKIIAAAQRHGVDPSGFEDAHMSKADGTYTCPECGQTFTTQAALAQHDAQDHSDDEGDDMTKREDDVAALTKRAETAEAALAALKAKTEPPDPLAKADPAVRDAVVKAQAEAAAAREEVTKLRDERERELYLKRAGAFKTFMKADDFGPLYRKIARALSAEELKTFDGKLAAICKQVETGALFSEAGAAGEADAGPEQRLNALAADLRKADPKLTHEQAYAKALDTADGRQLYSDVLKRAPRRQED